MKIFNTDQIKAWDNFTIENEPISSLKLMERASAIFVKWFIKNFNDVKIPIYILCGNGNNGGDGLAISRILSQKLYDVTPVIFTLSTKRSPDNQANLKAIKSLANVNLISLSNEDDFPIIEKNSIVIDALFGTGLKGNIDGYFKKLIEHVNQLDVIRIAVDIPSGLNGNSFSSGTVFKADYTFSFEQPKLSFMFPENQYYVGEWFSESIGLLKDFYNSENTNNHLLTEKVVSQKIKKRNKFGHKGNFGHSLLITGSKGKIGAAVLATLACLRSGSGLTTVYTPQCGYEILQTKIPEAMVITDVDHSVISSVPPIENYNAIGIGCGLGVDAKTQNAIIDLLNQTKQPLVIDADALNIIALQPELLNKVPKHSILTPHPKEFERLFGKSNNDFERFDKQMQNAKKLDCYILLKGAHSCIATPKGLCYFNTTGNPGMATAGSGDVLTGMITGLLAQGYSSKNSLCIAVYMHGLAGDLAKKKIGENSLIASDIIKYIPKAYMQLNKA